MPQRKRRAEVTTIEIEDKDQSIRRAAEMLLAQNPHWGMFYEKILGCGGWFAATTRRSTT